MAIRSMMNLRFLPFIAIACCALSACAVPEPAPRQPQQPPVRPVVTPPPAPAQPPQSGAWIDWPIAPGFWVYRQDDRGSIALFGAANADATITLRCDRGRQKLYLARAGNGAAATMTIRSSQTLKSFNAVPTGGNPSYLATEIAPNDRILDAVAATRGRIAIEVQGMPPIAIPIWSEVPRVIEDCR
jgi:hypothetical protein